MTPSTLAAFDPGLARFLAKPLDDLLGASSGSTRSPRIVEFFRAAAAEIPAYRDFLAARGVDPAQVNSIEAFAQLPLTDKPNYMHAYPLPERCRGGTLTTCDRVAVSSGSTGRPTFWPRSLRHEGDVAVRFEQVFRDSFRAHERSTLAVVCFALGNWVGGLFTTSCCWHLAHKGYPLLVATPGNHKAEIFRVIRELAPHFQQTVLLGYPPFVKDVIDAGLTEGIEWPRYCVKMVFAGEVFSEEWRSRVGLSVGSVSPCYDTASLYGTADGGVLGNETPPSIAIRRFLAATPDAARQLFGESRLPTLVQYDPSSRYFEVVEGTLAVSGDGGVPLLRYHIADKGGILACSELQGFLKDWGVDSLTDYGLDRGEPVRNLPFVYVFGRADFTVSYYGANVFPENVSVALERPEIADGLTGKFVLEVKEDQAGDKYLSVVAELLPDIAPSPSKTQAIAESVRRELRRLNSEFANYVPETRQLPVVALKPFEDPAYFPAGIKHRYTRRPAGST